MIRQCAYCLKLMGEKAPYYIKEVTHSICNECMIKMLKEEGFSTEAITYMMSQFEDEE